MSAMVAVGEVAILAGSAAILWGSLPLVARILTGSALAPLLFLVSALAMRGTQPLEAGFFLVRLVLSHGMGAIVVAGVAILVHAFLPISWSPLLLGFAGALLVQPFLQPWWLLWRARPVSPDPVHP